MKILISSLLVFYFSTSAFAISCPSGTKPLERVVGIFNANNGQANASAAFEKYMQNMVLILKRENILNALYLFKKDASNPQLIFYALDTLEGAQKILSLDKSGASKNFNIKLETWVECK